MLTNIFSPHSTGCGCGPVQVADSAQAQRDTRLHRILPLRTPSACHPTPTPAAQSDGQHPPLSSHGSPSSLPAVRTTSLDEQNAHGNSPQAGSAASPALHPNMGMVLLMQLIQAQQQMLSTSRQIGSLETMATLMPESNTAQQKATMELMLQNMQVQQTLLVSQLAQILRSIATPTPTTATLHQHQQGSSIPSAPGPVSPHTAPSAAPNSGPQGLTLGRSQTAPVAPTPSSVPLSLVPRPDSTSAHTPVARGLTAKTSGDSGTGLLANSGVVVGAEGGGEGGEGQQRLAVLAEKDNGRASSSNSLSHTASSPLGGPDPSIVKRGAESAGVVVPPGLDSAALSGSAAAGESEAATRPYLISPEELQVTSSQGRDAEQGSRPVSANTTDATTLRLAGQREPESLIASDFNTSSSPAPTLPPGLDKAAAAEFTISPIPSPPPADSEGYNRGLTVGGVNTAAPVVVPTAPSVLPLATLAALSIPSSSTSPTPASPTPTANSAVGGVVGGGGAVPQTRSARSSPAAGRRKNRANSSNTSSPHFFSRVQGPARFAALAVPVKRKEPKPSMFA